MNRRFVPRHSLSILELTVPLVLIRSLAQTREVDAAKVSFEVSESRGRRARSENFQSRGARCLFVPSFQGANSLASRSELSQGKKTGSGIVEEKEGERCGERGGGKGGPGS